MTLSTRLAYHTELRRQQRESAARQAARFALVTRTLAPRGVVRVFEDRNGIVCCELADGKVHKLTTLTRGG